MVVLLYRKQGFLKMQDKKDRRLKEFVQERLKEVSYGGVSWRWMFGSWALFKGGKMIGLIENKKDAASEEVLWLKVTQKVAGEKAPYFSYWVTKKTKSGEVERKIKHLHLFECPDDVLQEDERLKCWLEDIVEVSVDEQQILMAKFDKIV